jgi:hypothetical protein
VAVRHPADEAAAASGAPAGAGHIGAGTGLVDEYQMRGIKGELVPPPALACRRHVWPFLLAGVQDFFYS